MKNLKKINNGFSLIEILLSLLVIGIILVTVLCVYFSSSTGNTANTEAKMVTQTSENIKSLYSINSSYSDINNQYLIDHGVFEAKSLKNGKFVDKNGNSLTISPYNTGEGFNINMSFTSNDVCLKFIPTVIDKVSLINNNDPSKLTPSDYSKICDGQSGVTLTYIDKYISTDQTTTNSNSTPETGATTNEEETETDPSSGSNETNTGTTNTTNSSGGDTNTNTNTTGSTTTEETTDTNTTTNTTTDTGATTTDSSGNGASTTTNTNTTGNETTNSTNDGGGADLDPTFEAYKQNVLAHIEITYQDAGNPTYSLKPEDQNSSNETINMYITLDPIIINGKIYNQSDYSTKTYLLGHPNIITIRKLYLDIATATTRAQLNSIINLTIPNPNDTTSYIIDGLPGTSSGIIPEMMYTNYTGYITKNQDIDNIVAQADQVNADYAAYTAYCAKQASEGGTKCLYY